VDPVFALWNGVAIKFHSSLSHPSYAFFLDLFDVIIKMARTDKVTAEKEINPKTGS
jgi:hypothetical protein